MTEGEGVQKCSNLHEVISVDGVVVVVVVVVVYSLNRKHTLL